MFVPDSSLGPVLCEPTIILCIFLNELTVHWLPMGTTASVVPLNLLYVYCSAAADIVKINSVHLKAGCLLATAKKFASARLKRAPAAIVSTWPQLWIGERRKFDDHMSAGSRPMWTGGLIVHCDDWPVHKASGGNSWPAPAAATTISER